MSGHNFIGFCDGLIGLGQMNVHLIAVEVSVICRTVGVVEPQCLFFRQNSSDVGHHRGLVQGWLSIENQHITVGKVTVHNLATDLDLVSNTVSFLPGHVGEQNLFSSFLIFNNIGAWVHI